MCVALGEAGTAVWFRTGVAPGRMAVALAPVLRKSKLVKTSNEENVNIIFFRHRKNTSFLILCNISTDNKHVSAAPCAMIIIYLTTPAFSDHL